MGLDIGRWYLHETEEGTDKFVAKFLGEGVWLSYLFVDHDGRKFTSFDKNIANYKELSAEDSDMHESLYSERCITESEKENETNSAIDPDHYHTAIQPIDYIMANNLDFCSANIVKYVTRHRKKNGAEDIKKAIKYCEFILKYEYGQ